VYLKAAGIAVRPPSGWGDGTRKEHMEFLVTVPLLILDDLGMRKLPLTGG
jgi:hypothetical protein